MIDGPDATQWRQAGTIFDELVVLDPDERSARLSTMISDPGLRSAVEALLAGDAVADERLPQPGFGILQRWDAADPLQLVGRTISHFLVGEPLASGGMGIVYRAEDLQLRRPVALKFLLPYTQLTDSSKDRFLREARAAGALDHPNLCPIYEIGESSAGLFLAMPLYGGETLRDRLARDGTIAANDALAIASQIAAGLHSAHAAGIVHRDIKPGNIMLLPDGTAKILDFGLAKERAEPTVSRVLLGTVSYMSPEQIQGHAVDARALSCCRTSPTRSRHWCSRCSRRIRMRATQARRTWPTRSGRFAAAPVQSGAPRARFAECVGSRSPAVLASWP